MGFRKIGKVRYEVLVKTKYLHPPSEAPEPEPEHGGVVVGEVLVGGDNELKISFLNQKLF